MRGFKVCTGVLELVDFDYDKSGNEGKGCSGVEGGVREGADPFLGGRVRGL